MSDHEATRRIASRLAALPRLPESGVAVRPVRDEDGHDLTALVSSAYDEYACGPLDPERFDADLARPATSASASGRRWWVVISDVGAGRALVASVALGPLTTAPDGTPEMELHRLYLAPAVRGVGIASALVESVADEALRAGAGRLTAWSDTRLVDAHRRYLALGFSRTEEQRELGDPAGTTEARFIRSLGDHGTREAG
jgi:putative acetyltransferase